MKGGECQGCRPGDVFMVIPVLVIIATGASCLVSCRPQAPPTAILTPPPPTATSTSTATPSPLPADTPTSVATPTPVPTDTPTTTTPPSAPTDTPTPPYPDRYPHTDASYDTQPSRARRSGGIPGGHALRSIRCGPAVRKPAQAQNAVCSVVPGLGER